MLRRAGAGSKHDEKRGGRGRQPSPRLSMTGAPTPTPALLSRRIASRTAVNGPQLPFACVLCRWLTLDCLHWWFLLLLFALPGRCIRSAASDRHQPCRCRRRPHRRAHHKARTILARPLSCLASESGNAGRCGPVRVKGSCTTAAAVKGRVVKQLCGCCDTVNI